MRTGTSMTRNFSTALTTLWLLVSSTVTGSSAETVAHRSIESGWRFRQAGTEEWMPATVPGCNHTDLLANDRVPDPFWRTNELKLQWIDKEDWEYATTFQADAELLRKDRVVLHFAGLDTFATVMLNGKQVLEADNMFREWTVDAKQHLVLGDNELRVVFRSPIEEGIKRFDAYPYRIPTTKNDFAALGEVPGKKKVSVFLRKALYHFGWDWGPRLVSSGIWRPVSLISWDTARIRNVQVLQNKVSEKNADLSAIFEIESDKAGDATLDITYGGESLGRLAVRLEAGVSRHTVDFSIANPKLWWCNGLGEPHLYELTARVSGDGWSASVDERIGVRSLELVREPDQMGTPFYFRLNGVPVFMKGANIIPNDIYPTRVGPGKLRQLIEASTECHFNMLRVWGGGIYQSDEFYDLCDEAGLLVWQDFMFACSQFPGDEAFLDSVRQEAIDNVKRLRNHPSLALWCGNNESLSLHWTAAGEIKNPALQAKPRIAEQLWDSYSKLFHGVLADVVEEHDPSRSYWPSSPCAGPGRSTKVVGLEHGDVHFWGVWHGKRPYERYSTYIARFMSEYGFQSIPSIDTVETFALPEDLDIQSEVMRHHQRHPAGNDIVRHYMQQRFADPVDFESLIYASQVLQAEIIQYAVEAHRRAKPFCMGSLYWQLNDCWPVISWSSLDSEFRWKAQQYFMRKAFAPVLLSPFAKDGALSFHVVNDRLSGHSGSLRLRIVDFRGDLLWGKTFESRVDANAVQVAASLNERELLSGIDPSNAVLVGEWIEDGEVVAEANYYFRLTKDLALPTPEIDASFERVDGGYTLTLDSPSLAKNVYLSFGDSAAFVSDNFFDLIPGQTKSVLVETDDSLEAVRRSFECRTLIDAFPPATDSGRPSAN